MPELPPTLIPNRSPTGDISCALERPASFRINTLYYDSPHTHTHILSSNRLSTVSSRKVNSERTTLEHFVESQF